MRSRMKGQDSCTIKMSVRKVYSRNKISNKKSKGKNPNKNLTKEKPFTQKIKQMKCPPTIE